jgi:hypothetical protein
MLLALRRRLSYANVMATIAVFLALGASGYAIAARGVPDASGVFHGCVNSRSGALRVVARARLCHRAVRRGGRVIARGEFAIAWSERWPRGLNGLSGQSGQNGAPGQNGADGSAVAYAHVLSDGTLDTANSKNVLDISQRCGGTPPCSPSHGAQATQCFKLAGPVRNAVASTAFARATGVVRIPGDQFVNTLGGCPNGYTAAEVETIDTNSGAGTPEEFWVQFN